VGGSGATGGTGGSGATGGSSGTAGTGGSGAPDGSAGTTSKDAGSNPDVGGPADVVSRDAIDVRDAGSIDASSEGSNGDDGPPNRKPCTTNFGSGLTQAFGRLDGYLSAIIIPNQATCKPDNDHVYLQISMSNATYQIAVNVLSNRGDGGVESQVLYLEKGLTSLPDGAWQEGWHTGGSVTFDYVSNASVHAADFTATPLAVLSKTIADRLVNVNHISVFGTGYGPDGADLIHRNGSSHDGAIVTEPLSATPHVLMFHFSNQSF
jgi:hypothetical protein